MDYIRSGGADPIMIQCSNPLFQYLSYKTDIDTAIVRVLEKGWYILGEETKTFEEEFAKYIGVSYGVGVGNGTDAIHIALRACDVGRDDEVITVSHTAVATVAAIEMTGAKPVVVDIEADHYTLDPGKLEKAITPRTKAVIPVHLYGQPADLGPILDIASKHGICVIEDCAQAHGSMYGDRYAGCFGNMACFSFYPTKNLGAIGDGGMIITNDRQLALKARSLREYGWKERYVSQVSGWNTRLDEIQAAILRVKLKYLERDNEKRRNIAALYIDRLKNVGLVLPKTRDNVKHAYHLFVVRSRKRDPLLAFLKKKGIHASVHYPVPVHIQPAYLNRVIISGDLSETEKAAREILSLPIYPELKDEEVLEVVNAVKEFVTGGHKI